MPAKTNALPTSGDASFTQPIDANTRLCAVYGFPVRHSASPAMQNAGMSALGLNWRYIALEVKPENLHAALRGAQAMNFVGLNLTVPHKLLAMEMVDELDESARLWGAVNTVLFEAQSPDGSWQPAYALEGQGTGLRRSRGFNTDADAILHSIQEEFGMDLANRRVLLLGAGGAGRTAALKLASAKPAALFLVNRTREKAEAVAREIQVRHPGLSVSLDYPDGPIDLLLNATSLGLRPDDPLPLDQAHFLLRNAGSVYDMVYRPAETPLLKAARAAGCRTANGLGMLLHQGARALEIWTGKPAPIAIMRRALEKNVYGT